VVSPAIERWAVIGPVGCYGCGVFELEITAPATDIYGAYFPHVESAI